MEEPPLYTAVLYKGQVWVAQLGGNGIKGTVWNRVTGRGSSFQRWEYFNNEAIRINDQTEDIIRSDERQKLAKIVESFWVEDCGGNRNLNVCQTCMAYDAIMTVLNKEVSNEILDA